MAQRDSSPVYYREIQKNAYLKRLPDDPSWSKLRPLAIKKLPLKPMWTQLCIHNGRTPYLEQYRDPVTARAHRPSWRASLVSARHVTASVTPRDSEYDFLIDTHHGPVRLLAPSWEVMQDWVTTLRNKLHELKIVSLCENVYMSPPVAPPPRAAARDPTSPLPPTPPLPIDRVPGIDLTSVTRAAPPEPPPDPPPEVSPPPEVVPPETPIDISNWDDLSLPSTSQAPSSVAKICGQNICLDDSIFKRGASDDDDCSVESYDQDDTCERSTNITVIQVSNKDPPHTAIPVISDSNVFNFDPEFTNRPTPISNHPSPADPQFINIVHTDNDYGTVFTDSDYGHLSLTTTVNLTGDVKSNEDLYERLCMASTKPSPLPVRRLRNDRLRKSSLPNLDNSLYEYLFLSQNNNSVSVNSTATSNVTTVSSNTNITPSNTTNNVTVTNNTVSNTPISTSNTTHIQSNNTSGNTHSTPSDTACSITASNITSIAANSTSTVTVNSTEINSNRHVNSVAIVDSNTRGVRANIERTQSQNAFDSSRREKNGTRSNGKVEKTDVQSKPIWKRGLTELSLLTRIRGMGHGKRQESPNRGDSERNGITPPPKVVHRSRPEARMDRTRRRSSSLSNGQSPPSTSTPTALQPLRARQAASLIAAQTRGAALVACVPTADPPIFADYNKQVWVAWWGGGGVRCAGRVGDRVCGVRAAAPRDSAQAKLILHAQQTHSVDILFHRVPLGKIYVINKRDQESIGIKLDNECNITGIEPTSPAARAGLAPAGRWSVTEVNNRPINLLKGGEEDMNRLCLHGTEASVLIQPTALVKKLRAALKGNKTLLGLR